jgi:phosphohistidine phosphatase
MDCLLLRHGIAVERDEWKGADADRPLTEQGAKRVAQVAARREADSYLLESVDSGD